MNLKNFYKEDGDITEQVGSVNYKLLDKYMLSKLWRADVMDLLNGLITAIYGALLTYIYGVFDGLYQLAIKGEPFQVDISWNMMLIIGVFAGVSYLFKRFTSDRKGIILGEN
jgi:hypothetical protein